MALGLHHSVTLSFGVSSSSSSYCVFPERKHYGCQCIHKDNKYSLGERRRTRFPFLRTGWGWFHSLSSIQASRERWEQRNPWRATGGPCRGGAGEGISCLGVFRPFHHWRISVWSWWTQKFVEQLDKLPLLLKSIINSITYRVKHKLQAALSTKCLWEAEWWKMSIPDLGKAVQSVTSDPCCVPTTSSSPCLSHCSTFVLPE